MFSNVVRAAGEPRPAVREKANDKNNTNSKNKSDKDAGQRTPRRRRNSGSKGLPRRSLTLGILVETRNPPTASPSGQPQRVSITDSFGANPGSSAMDHSARRDPGRAKPTISNTASRTQS